MSTAYHARYFAHELTRRRPATGVGRLSRSLFDACVDLNPHQIDAALFAVRSPISKGVVLADEVGLGKTIEAGLVMCQYWAERRRRLLVVCPASLRKQWALELEEKFNLPAVVLDSRAYRRCIDEGSPTPFETDRVVIVSFHYANRMKDQIRLQRWDLAVIDEAHKLRNVYRRSNKIGRGVQWSLDETRKLLLTATPLQNTLLELYGLALLIDDRYFGDLASFRSRFTTVGADMDELRDRLRPLCHRTLRRQVLEYVQYTERRVITRPFRSSDEEHKLYEAVSEFLHRTDTYSIPSQQRHLTTLIIRKILASSSLAVAGTLETLKGRLIELREGLVDRRTLAERIIDAEDLENELLDELLDAEPESDDATEAEPVDQEVDRQKLDLEIEELDRYAAWARGVAVDAKTRALIQALDIGFAEMAKMGAARKALIFTESRRTQQYLRDFLEANGYAGDIVLFSGSNSSSEARVIYERWLEANRDTGRSSGSRVIDTRMALIEHFRDNCRVMIATEAAAEGVNLQFCSLVVNYDLPWNPQRIEQRIGRCHRYGQKCDVVVINFLNERNEADQRVYELLKDKFSLFSGVFGSSDEVLGSIESGVDFEKRVLAIYDQCRTREEIEAAFEALQDEMRTSIDERLAATRQYLLEHFDEEVHARLKMQLDDTREQLDHVGRMFWAATRYVLRERAAFDDARHSFVLRDPPCRQVQPGTYTLISKSRDNVIGEFLYRLSHPLGEHVVEVAKSLETPLAHVTFDISKHPTRISVVERLKGQSGWLVLQAVAIESFEREEYLLFSGFSDDGESIDSESCDKLFRCRASSKQAPPLPSEVRRRLEAEVGRHAEGTIARSLEANSRFFREEQERLDRWAEDMVLAIEKALSDTKAQLKTLKRQVRQATTTDEQHTLQLRIRQLERKQRRQRQDIFDTEDQIQDKRDALIGALERRLKQHTSAETLFTIRWSVT